MLIVLHSEIFEHLYPMNHRDCSTSKQCIALLIWDLQYELWLVVRTEVEFPTVSF